ncbi:MAG: glycerate kinase [Chloroflexi bacterium]|nr:glycerate kinase [Chloroflexota bacterium]
MHPDRFLTTSLRSSPHGERVTRILAAAINAVDPANAAAKYLKRHNEQLDVGEQRYDLNAFRRVFLIGFGKASLSMARTAIQILGDKLTRGILITKAHQNQLPLDNHQLVIVKAGHPIPDERGVEGAKLIIELLQKTKPNDLVIFLISGGGSALLTAPVPEVPLADLQTLNKLLLSCGADISEVNTLRKHLSQVKGGGLARLAHPAQVISLILSDVIGDPLDVIASGPTVPDPTTYSAALGIIEKYKLTRDMPSSILAHLWAGTSGEIPETPKKDDPVFERTQNIIVGNNLEAAQAAREQARQEGFNTLLLTTRLKGEARQIGPALAAIARQIVETGDPIPQPACIIAGGETTVTLNSPSPREMREFGGEVGLGGRNQELALSAVADLAGLQDVFLIAMATDGDDGLTDAAGAVVSGETSSQANLRGLNHAKFLARNDAYHFFDPLGDLLKPGLTMTNVNDLVFIFAF